MDPFQKFQNLYRKELDASNVIIPSSCCLSTIGTDGYPNARFVSLKEVKGNRFIITGPLDSRKGQELAYKPRAALTFWWPVTGKQVRIQGDALRIDASDADRYFSERPREAQVVSWVSKQGKPVDKKDTLKEQYNQLFDEFAGKKIPRPENWGGIGIEPVRIEFLAFSAERFHERVLYVRNGLQWNVQFLQP
jgi:pyridoxamine 5'-phosphate oxidase